MRKSERIKGMEKADALLPHIEKRLVKKGSGGLAAQKGLLHARSREEEEEGCRDAASDEGKLFQRGHA